MNSMLCCSPRCEAGQSGASAPATIARAPHRRPRAWGAALLLVALIAGFYLLREHWNQLAGTGPYLLLLACPLMHLFHGHGGHGKHDSHSRQPGQE
jgi:hypothetical protein